jgi:hypothetical protein
VSPRRAAHRRREGVPRSDESPGKSSGGFVTPTVADVSFVGRWPMEISFARRQFPPDIIRCHSAWGPNADRRRNTLNCPRKDGSNSEADSQQARCLEKLLVYPVGPSKQRTRITKESLLCETITRPRIYRLQSRRPRGHQIADYPR